MEQDVPAWDLYQLSETLLRFEVVMAEEAAMLNSYLVDEKGVYSIARLINDVR